MNADSATVKYSLTVQKEGSKVIKANRRKHNG